MSNETSGRRLATRADFLNLTSRRYHDVPIPGTALVVRIRSLFEGEKSRYELETMTKGGGFLAERVEDARRRLVCLTAVDADGELMFPQPDDLKRLEAVDGRATSVVYDAARDHCGFDKGDIEALVGNSVGVTAGGSESA